MGWLLVGCAPVIAPPAMPPLPTVTQRSQSLFDAQPTDETAITALILAERQAAIEQDLDLLGQLWALDARIVDGRRSRDASDDYIWPGRAAILDRYRVAVFPYVLPPLPALEADTVLTINGDEATVRHGTDRWQARRIEQRWWLTELQYQVPARE